MSVLFNNHRHCIQVIIYYIYYYIRLDFKLNRDEPVDKIRYSVCNTLISDMKFQDFSFNFYKEHFGYFYCVMLFFLPYIAAVYMLRGK